MTREEFLAIDDVVVRPVFVPEWDKTVHVRRLSPRDRARFEFLSNEAREKGVTALSLDYKAKFIINALCDEHGKPICVETDVEFVSTHYSATAIDVIYDAVWEMAFPSKADQETIEKNFESGLKNSSGTS